MSNKTICQIRKEFKEWSGFDLQGQTKEEMLDSVKQIHWSLECELDQQKGMFEEEIKKSNAPDPGGEWSE